MTRRFTYAEAAAELRVSETWLRRHIKALPHSKKGRVVTFTAEDLERIDALHHHEPTAGPLAIVSAPKPDGPHPMAQLRPLPRRGTAVRTS
ncbi:helix-turn-helix domain-containing protein [Streptomyces sp. NBC_01016]|uniref:helix-turn-helix domain-containing protein n=1 Tax=Streptomyces sp. NBC_01016 TaxID=2903720 RepID=UPI00225A6D6B|nr:helix-turn-helix domain-containing protein [Streptomyces sp. NBC_01016]MCX4827127.1 helix-turn-helix domain-containing protein [Streptomyces sp. NBC_01016]MCX4832384.1 helix-turn-helix domain-containing protein [Streptomyces sp. NBC_01016]